MEPNVQRSDFLSPTFTSYTDDKLALTASRVALASLPDYTDSDSDFEFPGFDGLIHSHADGFDDTSSSSDNEETFCVWVPKKSKSVGSSSKKWKLLEFLKRNNSDGKGDKLVILASERKERRRLNKDAKYKASPVEEFYVRNRVMQEGQKSKSFLPYKKDLVSFFC